MKVNGKKIQVGTRVRIIKGFRDGADMAGQEATYEGLCFVKSGK